MCRLGVTTLDHWLDYDAGRIDGRELRRRLWRRKRPPDNVMRGAELHRALARVTSTEEVYELAGLRPPPGADLGLTVLDTIEVKASRRWRLDDAEILLTARADRIVDDDTAVEFKVTRHPELAWWEPRAQWRAYIVQHGVERVRYVLLVLDEDDATRIARIETLELSIARDITEATLRGMLARYVSLSRAWQRQGNRWKRVTPTR